MALHHCLHLNMQYPVGTGLSRFGFTYLFSLNKFGHCFTVEMQYSVTFTQFHAFKLLFEVTQGELLSCVSEITSTLLQFYSNRSKHCWSVCALNWATLSTVSESKAAFWHSSVFGYLLQCIHRNDLFLCI